MALQIDGSWSDLSWSHFYSAEHDLQVYVDRTSSHHCRPFKEHFSHPDMEDNRQFDWSQLSKLQHIIHLTGNTKECQSQEGTLPNT